jgi:hypothetical protein
MSVLHFLSDLVVSLQEKNVYSQLEQWLAELVPKFSIGFS